MMMRSMKQVAFGAAVATMTLAASYSGASAAQFTLDPAGSAPALSNGAAFTADNMIFSQFSVIDINAVSGNFSENGILSVTQFQKAALPVFPAGFNGYTGATAYGLYFKFTGTGTSTGATAGATGNFTSLTVSLWGDVGYDNGAVNISGTNVAFAGNTGNDVLLASGTLLAGTVGLSANPGSGSPVLPSAFVTALFTQAPGQSGFFIDPATLQFSLDSGFTNSNQVTSYQKTGNNVRLTIRGGGGNGTLAAVPEPASLALFGAGLLGLGIARRARRKAA